MSCCISLILLITGFLRFKSSGTVILVFFTVKLSPTTSPSLETGEASRSRERTSPFFVTTSNFLTTIFLSVQPETRLLFNFLHVSSVRKSTSQIFLPKISSLLHPISRQKSSFISVNSPLAVMTKTGLRLLALIILLRLSNIYLPSLQSNFIC